MCQQFFEFFDWNRVEIEISFLGPPHDSGNIIYEDKDGIIEQQACETPICHRLNGQLRERLYRRLLSIFYV